MPLQKQQRLPIRVGDDIDEPDLHDSVGGGSMWAVASRSSWTRGRYAGGTFCPCANGSHAAGGVPCAACTCGVKLVSHNTFLTIQDEEAQEDTGAARRSLSL